MSKFPLIYTIISSELMYSLQKPCYTLRETLVDTPQDFISAVELTDILNQGNPTKAYFIEQTTPDDNTPHVIYGYNFTFSNNKFIRIKVKNVMLS